MSLPHTICIPISPASLEELEVSVAKIQNKIIEIYIDAIEAFDTKKFITIIKKAPTTIVVTLRRPKFGSLMLTDKTREEVLRALDGLNIYVDLDIYREATLIEFIKVNKLTIPLIVSYHNYDCTPDMEAMSKIIKDARTVLPQVVKIACACTDPGEVIRLLNLIIDLKTSSAKFIVTGMGEQGKIPRIIGALWGNEWTYAPNTTEESTAPGQLTVDELQQVLSLIQ